MISKRHSKSRTLFAVLSCCAVILVLCSYLISTQIFQSVEIEKSRTKLSLYQTVIENELSRLAHLPHLLAKEVAIDDPDGLNQKLKSISLSSKAEAIFLLDRTGTTVAASNFDSPQTFLGQNYQFRPYFLNAMKGKDSSFFAIGATTSRPGYFLGAPVVFEDQPIGALVVKLDLTALNKALAATNDKIVVTNKDGIVVLASDNELRYRATRQINELRMLEINEERQFGKEKLAKLDWQVDSGKVVLDAQKYLLLSASLAQQNWQLYYLADANFAQTRALMVSAILAAILIFAFALFFIFRERRVREALVSSQQDRRRLKREIEVRRKAEQRLEKAQVALKRNSKLAALGQLSASVTHELGQPIAAMKNHIVADMLNKKKQSKTMASLSGIVDRMESITKQLKFFATVGDDFEDGIYLEDILNRAIELMEYDLNSISVSSNYEVTPKKFKVNGNAQRLEQVIINILRNSIKAVDDVEQKTINIEIEQVGAFNSIRISDNGHGLRGQSLEQMIEPFHTTGPSGSGMGLGLAISASIIDEHGGEMLVEDLGNGSMFEIKLPIAEN